MSVPVALGELRAALAERPSSAYLLSVSDDGRPHAVHVGLAWDGDRLAAEVGRRTAANAATRPAVSLVFPLRTPDDYSLIVDGTASPADGSGGADSRRILIAPTKAVLHRAAAAPDPSSACGSDCVPLVEPSPRPRG
ncbi:MAG: pyridoxamine 5'-phosphate oxidase family protein [Deltaproteobacteria bacterium]|nr:pyridoxamine 5'-phosphate oxidase family protein [Deltaproteobacteria bacterium]